MERKKGGDGQRERAGRGEGDEDRGQKERKGDQRMWEEGREAGRGRGGKNREREDDH